MDGQNSATLRTFIAVHLPEAARAELGAVSSALAAQMPPRSVRWVQPHLLHLTLRFLGETAVSQLAPLAAELDRVAARFAPLTLRLADLGCFPNRQRPRVIWAGLEGDLPAVQALQKEIELAVRSLGWPAEDKPFRAHLTLGRVPDGRLLQGVKWGSSVPGLPVPVTAIHLVESQLRPSGPIYTTRHSSPLQAA